MHRSRTKQSFYFVVIVFCLSLSLSLPLSLFRISYLYIVYLCIRVTKYVHTPYLPMHAIGQQFIISPKMDWGWLPRLPWPSFLNGELATDEGLGPKSMIPVQPAVICIGRIDRH